MSDPSQSQYREMDVHLRLLADLFDARGSDAESSASLWATNPEEFGAEGDTIPRWRGRAEAYKAAASLIRERYQL